MSGGKAQMLGNFQELSRTKSRYKAPTCCCHLELGCRPGYTMNISVKEGLLQMLQTEFLVLDDLKCFSQIPSLSGSITR
jgi:hypothetical protein